MNKSTFRHRLNTAQTVMILVLLVGMGLTLWLESKRSAAELRAERLNSSTERIRLDLQQMANILRGQLLDPKGGMDRKPTVDPEKDLVETADILQMEFGAASEIYLPLKNLLDFVRGPLASRRRADGDIDVTEPLADGDYLLTLVVEKATSGLKDTLKTQVRMAAPQRIRIDLVFAVEGGVLKARHETANNAIGNLR